MARNQPSSSSPTAELAPPVVPSFRRPRPEDAVDLAYATFLSGARVEMGALGEQLGISQQTLYRWVGNRERLLDQVIGRAAQEASDAVLTGLEGEGDERVFEFVRRIMGVSAALEAGLEFMAREPQLALRLALGTTGAAHKSFTAALSKVVHETRPPEQAQALDGHVDLIVEICTGLLWSAIAVGDEPKIQGAVEVVRQFLRGARETS